MAKHAHIRQLWSSGWGTVLNVIEFAEPPQPMFGVNSWVVVDSQTPKPPVPYDPDAQVWWYQYATDTFSSTDPGAVEPATVRRWRPKAFWYHKLDPDERARTWAALAGLDLGTVSFTAEKDRWRLKAWRDLSLSQNIDLDNFETVWAVNMLEDANIIAAGRAAEILT